MEGFLRVHDWRFLYCAVDAGLFDAGLFDAVEAIVGSQFTVTRLRVGLWSGTF
jgi:hypothetical protein